MDQVVGGMIAAIPRGLIVHQYRNLRRARRRCDGPGILEADRQRFFHHHRDKAARRRLHHTPMIVSARITEHRIRMRLLDRVVEISIIELLVQIEFSRVLLEQHAIGLGNPHDLKIGTMLIALEKSGGVPVHESGDDDL